MGLVIYKYTFVVVCGSYRGKVELSGVIHPHRADGAEVVKFLEKMYSIGYWGIYDILFYLGLVLSNK